jgi:hypothetical protein
MKQESTSRFYIVNSCDRPDEKHIAEKRRNGLFYYIHPALRHERRYWKMNPLNPTPVFDFGISIEIENGMIRGSLVSPSVAKYGDDRTRKWQGSDSFTFDYQQRAKKMSQLNHQSQKTNSKTNKMKDNEKQVQEIAKQIDEIIESTVRERAPKKDAETQLKEIYWRFKVMLKDAKYINEDLKKEGLTFSAIEAEGYLRAILSVEILLQNQTSYKKDS